MVPGDVAPVFMACRDNLEFMAGLPDGSMMLIVTSPPYNNGKEYERRIALDAWRDGQRQVLMECLRLLHPQGSICWQLGNHASNGEIVPLDMVLFPVFQDMGLRLRNRIVWRYGHGEHCRRRFSGRYETILWWTRSGPYKWNLDPVRIPAKYPGKRAYKGPKAGQLSGNPKGKNPSDVWEIPNVKHGHPEKTLHPCQFPVELVERLVLSMTDEGDAVFDPFMGVGSSIVAALRHGRAAYGCDTVPDYVEIAFERVRAWKAENLRTGAADKPVGGPERRLAQPGGHLRA